MNTPQRWRASTTFTETQWATFIASATARRSFSRGAFALVIADQDGAFVALYQKGQNGADVGAFVQIAPAGGGSLPAPPAAVLADPATPDRTVRLDGDGKGVTVTDAQLAALLVAAGLVDLTTAQTLAGLKTLTQPLLQNLYTLNERLAVKLNQIALQDEYFDLTPGRTGVQTGVLTMDGPATNIGMVVQPKGNEFVNLSRARANRGTTAEILGAAGVFAAPQIGMMGFSSDHVPPVPVWFTGTAWVLADGTTLV